MKKVLSVLLVAVIFSALLFGMSGGVMAAEEVSVWDGSSGKSIATGTGTEADPYIIMNAAELDYVATACMSGETFTGKFIKLGVNINWGGREWTSIGYSTTTVFSGSFDGNGKTIFNLTCKDVTVGIFAYATNATIKNLNVDYATFTTDTRYAGAIVGLLRGSTVSGCSAGENVTIQTNDSMSNTAQIGGLFGLVNSSMVDNCVFNGKVIATSITGISFVGGIAGVIGNISEVSYCINNGSVSVPNACLVTGSFANVGGISGGIGSTNAVGSVINCINTGEVTAVEYAAGVVGRIHVANSVITDCYNIGSVTSTAGFAGSVIADIANAGEFSGCIGITSATATAAYAKIADGITLASGAVKTGTTAEITALESYKKIEKSINDNLPVFGEVDPNAVPETTAGPVETTVSPVETTAKPVETTAAPVETTAAPVETTAAAPLETTAKPADTEKGGCGSVFAGGAIIIVAIFGAALTFKKEFHK